MVAGATTGNQSGRQQEIRGAATSSGDRDLAGAAARAEEQLRRGQRRPQLPPGRLAHHASAAAVLDSSSRARFDQWLRDFELQASVNAQGEGGNGSAGGDGGDADEGYAAWIAELKECLLQAGVHNRPAALMGDASLLSEATLRDVGALLTGGVDVRVGGLCLQEAGIYTHAEEEQVAANCRRDCYDAAASA